MTEAQKDTARAHGALKEIFDGRDPVGDMSSIMVTLEHTVSGALLVVMGGDPRKAATMLNEGLVEGVEKRLGYFSSKQSQ